MRIATWNLQCPRPTQTVRWAEMRKQLEAINADIWILTETHSDVLGDGEFFGHHTVPIARIHKSGSCRTSVWSRFKTLDVVATNDDETSICVSIQAPTGPMLIYGTIIPYGGAGTKYRYRSNGTDHVEQKSWQLHSAAIARLKNDWTRLRDRFPEHGFCAGGDFNQTRDGRKTYGTMAGRQQLTDALTATGLSCTTEDDFVATGMLSNKSVIDHLCLDSVLASKVHVVQPWAPNNIDGKPISDHGGVFVDIKGPP